MADNVMRAPSARCSCSGARLVATFAMLAGCDATLAASGEPALALRIIAPAGVTLTTMDQLRVRLEGPTARIVTVTPGTTVSIDGLLPGMYTVSLEGLVAGEVETFGETAGVDATAGNTDVTVTMDSFVPDSVSVPSTGVQGQQVSVQFGEVAGASSYVVEWASDSAFTSLRSTPTSSSNANLTIETAGFAHVRVRALNHFGSTGRPSAHRTIEVRDSAVVLAVAPTTLLFRGEAEGPSPAPQTVSISNTGRGTLNWNVTDNAPWLSVSPATGTQTGTLLVSINSAGLAAGTYNAVMAVNGNAGNAPRTIPIQLVLARRVLVTTSAGQFAVITVDGSFSQLDSLLRSQIWFGDSTLAGEFATAVGLQLGSWSFYAFSPHGPNFNFAATPLVAFPGSLEIRSRFWVEDPRFPPPGLNVGFVVQGLNVTWGVARRVSAPTGANSPSGSRPLR